MSVVDFKSILGAVLCGMGLFAVLSIYETNKIAEIQAAGPEDDIVPPPAPLLFCVNHKLIISFLIACIILGLASYGSKPPPRVAPEVPPAKV